jgi:hypothetical protein
MTIIQARDPWGKPISGALAKRYPKGITIDDARGIRHYVTLDRVVGEAAEPVHETPEETDLDLDILSLLV